ncbi:piggyBac transposable element-derived protein 4-like [Homalodisca vitripennis]|uniref:piggyBac transposable element-derived protein 4-like n=1 Tax=Homalodisca vitripennis TaxID=197043 RepID=UPI001EEB9D87|nr:piggyBac transposable element-derived protein 4-like [Homalodisca vitripennis]
MENKSIEAWLVETEDIPSDPESEDDEDQVYPDVAEGIYTVAENGILEVDYLDLAQTAEGNEIPILIINENDFQDNHSAEGVEPGIPEGNAVLDVQNQPMDVQFDEDSEPLANRLYKDSVTWYQKYYSPNKSYDFNERTGPLIDASTPVDVFSALFPDDLVDKLVFETNVYATQIGGGVIRFPTTRKEMKVFLGLNILMGIKKLPSYRDYWSSEADLRDDYISSYMSVNRFGWLLTNLHINNNNDMPERDSPNYDKLYKIRPLLNKLQETYKACYAPSRFQSIDESMIPFKGRSGIKQYMPDKPTKRGYKVWVRADEKGFISQFQIYEECLPEGKHMNQGEHDFMSTMTGIVAVEWKDKRGIYFLSNYHNPNEVTTVNRKQANGEIVAVPCPILVKDYNAHMGYVDKADMLKSTYSIDRKSKKWWHRIFWHFLDTTIVNSFIIFSMLSQGKPLTLKEFRRSVSKALLGVPRGETRGRRSSSTPINNYKPKVPQELRFTENAHMPVRGTSRRCAQCSSKEEVHRSKWVCETCGVALCLSELKDCFRAYHRKE